MKQEHDDSVATCLFGIGNNTYIAGNSDGVNNVWGYWVNGNYVTLPGYNNVYDVFVK